MLAVNLQAQSDSGQTVLSDPMAVLAFLGLVVAAIFWLASRPQYKNFFDRTPPVM